MHSHPMIRKDLSECHAGAADCRSLVQDDGTGEDFNDDWATQGVWRCDGCDFNLCRKCME